MPRIPHVSQQDEALRRARSGRLLDWRHAKTSDPMRPCVLCGRPAILIDPDTDQPKHKVCAEEQLARSEAQS